MMKPFNLKLKESNIGSWTLVITNNADRLGLYERTVTMFWDMRNLMDHVMWECSKKVEGDATLNQCWKDHYVETIEVNVKMDVVMETLGIQSLNPLVGQCSGATSDLEEVFLRNMLSPCGF